MSIVILYIQYYYYYYHHIFTSFALKRKQPLFPKPINTYIPITPVIQKTHCIPTMFSLPPPKTGLPWQVRSPTCTAKSGGSSPKTRGPKTTQRTAPFSESPETSGHPTGSLGLGSPMCHFKVGRGLLLGGRDSN